MKEFEGMERSCNYIYIFFVETERERERRGLIRYIFYSPGIIFLSPLPKLGGGFEGIMKYSCNYVYIYFFR